MRRLVFMALGLASLSLLLAACGSSVSEERSGGAASLTQQDSGEGGVTVEATWVTDEHAETDAIAAKLEQYPLDRYVAFHLKLDTHSGDLNEYDLVRIAYLTVDGGTSQAAVTWVSQSNDSHHREGLLVFVRPDGGKTVELTLRDIAGVSQRVLRWSPAPED